MARYAPVRLLVLWTKKYRAYHGKDRAKETQRKEREFSSAQQQCATLSKWLSPAERRRAGMKKSEPVKRGKNR